MGILKSHESRFRQSPACNPPNPGSDIFPLAPASVNAVHYLILSLKHNHPDAIPRRAAKASSGKGKRMNRIIKKRGVLLAFLLPWLWTAAAAPESTAPVIGLHKNTPRVTAFINARIVQAPGKTLERATMIVRDGCIEAVGAGVTLPPDAVVRDLAGKTLYPGFVDLYTRYGVPEKVTENPGARHWNNHIRPEARAAGQFRPDAKVAAMLRGNGFTAVAAYPREGIVRGSGALVLTGDEGVSARAFADSIGQALSFTSSGGDYPESLMGRIALIRQTFLDARWYSRECEAYRTAPTGREAPELNRSLEALLPCALGATPAVVETDGLLDIFRATDLARELGLNPLVVGSGVEYERLDAVKRAGIRLILPVDFPATPEVSAEEANLRELRRWDFAPENPARLEKAGVEFALTAYGLDKPENFLKNVRLAVKRGLSADTALRALTMTPAAWIAQSNRLGTLEKGKIANFLVTDGDFFAEKTKILDAWVAGERYEVTVAPEADVRGTWTLRTTPSDSIGPLQLAITGEADKPEVMVSAAGKKVKALKTVLDKRLLTVVFSTDSLGWAGVARLSGIAEAGGLSGRGTWPDNRDFTWTAELKEPWKAKPDTTKVEPSKAAEFPAVFPESPFGRVALPVQPEALLIKNASVWTCGPKGMLKNTDILVRKGKIAEVGHNLNAPSGAVVIDAAGKHVTPGLIDAHSHMAISRGINEGSHSITSEVRIRDVLDAEDVAIYRHLALGLTAACVCHGSANAIGGEDTVIKLRWGALPDELPVEGQTPMQKFALGENVKQSNITGRVTRLSINPHGNGTVHPRLLPRGSGLPKGMEGLFRRCEEEQESPPASSRPAARTPGGNPGRKAPDSVPRLSSGRDPRAHADRRRPGVHGRNVHPHPGRVQGRRCFESPWRVIHGFRGPLGIQSGDVRRHPL